VGLLAAMNAVIRLFVAHAADVGLISVIRAVVPGLTCTRVTSETHSIAMKMRPLHHHSAVL
jgi:hypothetical protein